MGYKAHHLVIENRRQMVARLRLRGLSQREIAKALGDQAMAEGEVGPSLATVNGDLQAIEAQWREQAVQDIAAHKSRILAGLEEVAREAWKDHDLGLVLKVLAREALLLGANEPLRITGLHVNMDLSQLSQEQIEALARGENPFAAQLQAAALALPPGVVIDQEEPDAD